MALGHDDLFFVNRSNSTYKIRADEVGQYLINTELPDGTKFVNDGKLSVANTGNQNLVTPIVIHSANAVGDSELDFDSHFVVQRGGNGATVTLNFMEVKDSLLCNGGVGSGFDLNGCDCLALDFVEIGDQITCGEGIISDNGCLKLNLCADSMIIVGGSNSEGACLDINVCTDKGISTSSGCLAVDMNYILQRIACPDGGLTTSTGCLAVDYGKVMSTMGLGVIKTSSLQSITFGAGNQDLTKGDVSLEVDWTTNPNNLSITRIEDLERKMESLEKRIATLEGHK